MNHSFWSWEFTKRGQPTIISWKWQSFTTTFLFRWHSPHPVQYLFIKVSRKIWALLYALAFFLLQLYNRLACLWVFDTMQKPSNSFILSYKLLSTNLLQVCEWTDKKGHFIIWTDIFSFCSNFWNSDAESDATKLYWANEIKCRKLTKTVFVFLCIELSTIFGMLMVAIIDIFMGHADDTSKWNLPIELVVPFDTRLISGWILNWFYQFDMCFVYLMHMITITTHFACCCYYIMTMCAHFDQMIASIRNDSKQAKMEKNIGKRQKIWNNSEKKLQRAIQLHAKIYE